jgi:DNA polymerase
MSIQELREKCLACRACPLGGQEIEPKCFSNVFSNMNVVVRIMVVGQNPGRDEVKQGEPFVGASGKFFNEAIKNIIHLERSSFYISNVLRCFSPGNRPPTSQELEACRPILDEEIRLLKPELVIALGRVAFERLTGMSGIMRHHGEVIVSPRYLIPVIPLLHPSPLNTNDTAKREMFHEGLRKVGEFLCTIGK